MAKATRRKERNIETDLFGLKIIEGGINSKAKGDANEVEACKFMKKWTKEDFSRVPRSGGMRWKNNSSVCGDIVCQNEDFKFIFSVETKHLKKILLTGQMSADRSAVLTIWEQCKEDAIRANKHPLLLLRINGMAKGSYIVYFEEKHYINLLNNGFDDLPLAAFWPLPTSQAIVGITSEDLLTIPYEVMVKVVALSNEKID